VKVEGMPRGRLQASARGKGEWIHAPWITTIKSSVPQVVRLKQNYTATIL
jgi:hypothetical protein